jgi:ATP-dependent helicase YprA (DUF1998 family)
VLLDEVIDRLLNAIAIKHSALSNALQSIIPDPQTGFSGNRYIPLLRVTPRPINESWKQFYQLNILNKLANDLNLKDGAQNLSISSNVDKLIGEAIYNRLSRHNIKDPKPYEHQARTIIWALYALDQIIQFLTSFKQYNYQNISNIISLKPRRDAVALLAPTATGKTEVLETIAFQLAIDGVRAGFTSTKVIMIYPMKEFMKDHIKRFIRDLTYLYLKNQKLSIGLLNEDIKDLNELSINSRDLENYLSMFFETDQNGKPLCPIHDTPLSYRVIGDNINVTCSRYQHEFDFIKFTRDAIRSEPPDILLITPDMLNIIMRNTSAKSDSYKKIFGFEDSFGFPLVIILDEPHIYSGIFGTNVSLLLRDLRELIRQIARRYGLDYEPFILATSATLPNPQTILAKLLVVDPSSIEIIMPGSSGTQFMSNKGVLALLPAPGWGIRNARVEIVPLLAAILPPNERRILVFVDSTELAERLVYQITDYISRESGFWEEYAVCKNITSIFQPDVCPNGAPNKEFITIESLSAKMDDEVRREIAENFRTGKINVLVTTSALEVGVDIGDINYVILVGLPPTPINFEQRIGRVGRRGQDSLVIVLGNEYSGVDTYYLSSQQRFLDYIRSVRQYDIPLNPANPYAIRAYTGNFATSLTWYSSSQPYPPQDIINRYIDVAIKNPQSLFLQSSHSMLKIIGRYLQQSQYDLANQLRTLLKTLLEGFKYSSFPSFYSLDVWKKISQGWSEHLKNQWGLLEVVTPLRNLRTLGKQIPLKFKVRSTRRRQTQLLELNDDVILAVLTYSLSEISSKNLRNVEINIELPPMHKLRGVVTLKTVKIGDRNFRMPFETVGGLFKPFAPFNPYYLQKINPALCPHGNFSLCVIELTEKSFQQTQIVLKTLKQISEYIGQKNKNLIKIIESIENYINNIIRPVKQHFANQSIYSYPSPNDFRIYEPEELYFRPLEPLCFVDKSGQLNCKDKISKSDLENASEPLFYYEILSSKSQTRSVRFVNKIDLRPIFQKINLELPQKVPSPPDFKNRDLLVFLPNSLSYSYKNIKGNVDVTNAVTTRAVVLPVFLEEKSLIDKKQARDVEVALTSVRLLYANLGYTVEATPGAKYMKRIGTRYNPSIIGTTIETYALNITIDWDSWLSHSPVNNLVNDIGNDVMEFNQQINQQTWRQNPSDLLEAFKVTVSHSLSHVLLNFHSMYTGGNSRDLSEVIIFETEGDKIKKSRIYLYDTVQGGNGISELLFYYINDIINDALTVLFTRHMQARHSKQHKFLLSGEPGDVILGIWPRCPYYNVALSRLWLLRFLALHSGATLQQWEQIGAPPRNYTFP